MFVLGNPTLGTNLGSRIIAYPGWCPRPILVACIIILIIIIIIIISLLLLLLLVLVVVVVVVVKRPVVKCPYLRTSEVDWDDGMYDKYSMT